MQTFVKEAGRLSKKNKLNCASRVIHYPIKNSSEWAKGQSSQSIHSFSAFRNILSLLFFYFSVAWKDANF